MGGFGGGYGAVSSCELSVGVVRVGYSMGVMPGEGQQYARESEHAVQVVSHAVEGGFECSRGQRLQPSASDSFSPEARVQGSGFRVRGSEFRVQSSGFRRIVGEVG